MTFSFDLDTRSIGAGIYNYIQAGLNVAIPRWAEMAGDMLLENWQAAASGQVFPGMTRPLYSDTYRSTLERTPVSFMGNEAVVSVSAPEEVQMASGQPFDLHRMIEFGRPSYSIRDAWMRRGAAGARTGKNGPFIIIPFRHGAGESVHFQMNLDPKVKRMARTGGVSEARYSRVRNPWESAATHAVHHGGPSSALGLGPRYIKAGMTAEYTWRRPIHAGVRRVGRSRHTQYVTFRTMSASSDPNSWVVPALAANPVAQSVLAFVRDEMSRRIRRDMEQMSQQGGMRA